MAQFKADVYDYDSALAHLNGHQARKLAHNTFVHLMQFPHNTIIAVTLHGHVIAEFWERGDKRYSHCGYGTVTTRDRLNQLSKDLKFFQRKGEQYFTHTCGNGIEHTEKFHGEVALDQFGHIVYNREAA